jgi:hypothetical protein
MRSGQRRRHRFRLGDGEVDAAIADGAQVILDQQRDQRLASRRWQLNARQNDGFIQIR